jgi:hypothetical protein
MQRYGAKHSVGYFCAALLEGTLEWRDVGFTSSPDAQPEREEFDPLPTVTNDAPTDDFLTSLFQPQLPLHPQSFGDLPLDQATGLSPFLNLGAFRVDVDRVAETTVMVSADQHMLDSGIAGQLDFVTDSAEQHFVHQLPGESASRLDNPTSNADQIWESIVRGGNSLQ